MNQEGHSSYFSLQGPWAGTILALSPGPGSSHVSWNCSTEFCFLNFEPQWPVGKFTFSLAHGSVCSCGLWEATLLDLLQILAHFLILAWGRGEEDRRESLTKMGSS